MPDFLKKALFWIVLVVLIIAAILLINWKIDNDKNEKSSEKSENKPKPENPPPPSNPPPPPEDKENWWLGDEEIEHAYSEMRKELGNSSEIKLVSPSVVRVIQENGEIDEDLKKAKLIFFPINNSENRETADAGNHWTLLVCEKAPKGNNFCIFHNCNSAGSSVPANATKLAKKFSEKLGVGDFFQIFSDYVFPQQTNGSDCGLFVIAYTRAWIREVKRQPVSPNLQLKEKDFVFSIAEERQKLKAVGFPKNDSGGGNYDIGDDVAYTEDEENQILEWWKQKSGWETPLRRESMVNWLKYLLEEQLFDLAASPDKAANNFKEFSKKVRLLSEESKIEKEKLVQIYRIKKILKYCSLPLEEYKKTKSFAGENNFSDKLTEAEEKFIKEVINKETAEEINQLYTTCFPK